MKDADVSTMLVASAGMVTDGTQPQCGMLDHKCLHLGLSRVLTWPVRPFPPPEPSACESLAFEL